MKARDLHKAVDATGFEQFKRKRLEWILWLNGDDIHSVRKQASALLWDYALFRTINDLRNGATQGEAQDIGFNEPILRLLDAGFVATQGMGIRRLTDRRDDVISLTRLVDDIEKNRKLPTREFYLSCHGLPYDFAPLKNEHFKNLEAAGPGFTFEGLDTQGSNAWHSAEQAHNRFDKLCETCPSCRSREDKVSISCIKFLKAKIAICDDTWMFATKFIAHAATSKSRVRLTEDQTGVSLAKLSACHKALFKVAAFVGTHLLQDTLPYSVPTPQFDPCNNLDKRLIDPSSISRARDYWNQHFDEIKQWDSEVE